MSQQTTRSNSQPPTTNRPAPNTRLSSSKRAPGVQAPATRDADDASAEIKVTDPGRLQQLWKLPVPVSSLTNSPGCEPRKRSRASIAPVARVRPVRVDAWSEPASVSWTRTRKTVRKVAAPRPKPTEWALPF